MLGLCSNRWLMTLTRRRLFLSGWPRLDSSIAAVVADAVDYSCVVDDGGVVDVVDIGYADIIHGPVIEKPSALPTSAEVTHSGVAEAIRNAAIKTNCWTPVAFVPDECRTA